MNKIQIITEDQINLAELIALNGKQKTTFSPHIGNKWREDLYLMKLGIPTINFDRNTTVSDDLDLPDRFRIAEEIYDLAQQTRVKVLSPYMDFADQLPLPALPYIEKFSARNPAQLHQLASQAAVPEANFKLESADLLYSEESELLMAIINLASKAALDTEMEIFSRYVDQEGVSHRLKIPGQTEQYAKTPINYLELSPEDRAKSGQSFLSLCERICNRVLEGGEKIGMEGFLPRIEFFNLLFSIKQMLSDWKNGKKIPVDQQGVYHSYLVSGPSMLAYSKGKNTIKALEYYYGLVRDLASNKLGLDLPEDLAIHFIPGSSLDYWPVKGESRLLDAANQLAEIETRIKLTKETRLSTDKDVFLGKIKELNNQHSSAIRNIAAEARNLRFVSQYDLLNGVQLYSKADLEGLLQISFKTHSAISNLIKKPK